MSPFARPIVLRRAAKYGRLGAPSGHRMPTTPPPAVLEDRR